MSQKICITGANRGLGLGLTEHYLKTGGRVVAVARRVKDCLPLRTLGQKYPQQLQCVDADITDEEARVRLKKVLDQEPLDILINNAGVLLDRQGEFQRISLDSLRRSFEVNVIGSFAITQLALGALKNGTKPTVAMISSQMASLEDNSSGGTYAYRSSKAALNMVSRSLAIDFPWLLSITLHPGWVQTDMGGAHATTTIEESVQGLTQVIGELKKEDSGSFKNYRGQTLPW